MILVRVRYSLFLLARLRQITEHFILLKLMPFGTGSEMRIMYLTYYKRINLITRRIVLVVGATSASILVLKVHLSE